MTRQQGACPSIPAWASAGCAGEGGTQVLLHLLEFPSRGKFHQGSQCCPPFFLTHKPVSSLVHPNKLFTLKSFSKTLLLEEHKPKHYLMFYLIMPQKSPVWGNCPGSLLLRHATLCLQTTRPFCSLCSPQSTFTEYCMNMCVHCVCVHTRVSFHSPNGNLHFQHCS